jgi:metal-sulfur cluster biosynthetic enzyme
MGLIVDIQQREGVVDLKLTFTAMGCPAMDFIMDDIRERLLREPGVQQVNIEIVWDPVWSKNRLSEEGIDIMRTWGISA